MAEKASRAISRDMGPLSQPPFSKNPEFFWGEGDLVGGVKQGRFVILRFPLFCSVWGSYQSSYPAEVRK